MERLADEYAPVVQVLDAPVPKEVAELFVSKIMGEFPSADTEQVIEVRQHNPAAPRSHGAADIGKACGNSSTIFCELS